jgi:hypothetical protein
MSCTTDNGLGIYVSTGFGLLQLNSRFIAKSAKKLNLNSPACIA